MNSRDYWNRKIIKWEVSRYSRWGVLRPTSWSVRSRMNKSVEFVNGLLKTGVRIKILDLGCGSGELARRLLVHPKVSYWGLDIAEQAILKAQRTLQREGFCFQVVDLETCEDLPKADVALMLGLVDWISASSLKSLLTKIESEFLLISFTEKRSGFRNGIYGLYRGMRDRSAQQAQSLSSRDFVELYRSCGWKLDQDLSNNAMSPGRLLWLKRNTST